METQDQSATIDTMPAASENQETVRDANALLDKNKQLLAEAKKAKDELKELRTWKEELELKEKEQKGQYQEVIAALRDENRTLKEQYESDKKAAAYNKFESQVKMFAKEQGCVNPDALMKLMSKEQMASVEVDEKFNVNQDDLTRLLDTMKNEHNYMFNSPKVNINNVTGGFKMEKPSLESMSKEELLAQILNS